VERWIAGTRDWSGWKSGTMAIWLRFPQVSGINYLITVPPTRKSWRTPRISEQSIPSRPRAAVSARASFGVLDTIEDALFLRENLPCLRQYRNVWVDLSRALWVYPTEVTSTTLPLSISGFRVYTFPGETGIISGGIDADPAPMDTGEFLSTDTCHTIANHFPHSVGIRVHTFGLVEILYESQKQLNAQKRRLPHLPDSLGSMPYSFAVMDTSPSSPQVDPNDESSSVLAGMQVAARANDIELGRGCIGLRIRRPGDTEDCWTTTTHAWVKLPGEGKVALRNVAASVAMFVRKKGRVLSNALKVFQTRAAASTVGQAVGTTVYVAGDQLLVSTVRSKAIPTS